jgi:tetratricopeptide (TPR) repeat protein
LRSTLLHHPQDFWLHFSLGAAIAQGPDEKVGCYRAALALRPDCSAAHNNLGVALQQKGDLDGAIAAFRNAIHLNQDFAHAHSNLGAALADKGKLSEAIEEYRRALRSQDLFTAQYNLGLALRKTGKKHEAITTLRKAIGLNPKDPDAHCALATALLDRNDVSSVVEAIVEYRKAIDFKKDFAIAYFGLGMALDRQGKTNEAIVAFQQATHFNKEYAKAYLHLGTALGETGRYDEAIVAFKAVIRLQKDSADAYNNLGMALQLKGLVDEAIVAFRQALNLGTDRPEIHCALGQALQAGGFFAEGLVHLRRGHELGSKRPGWPFPTPRLIQEGQRLVELDGKLPAMLNREEKPANAAEMIEYAQLCHRKRLHASAVDFFRAAFRARPALATNSYNRADAASDAALAGCGQGKEVTGLDEKKRALLRQQALDWLRANLDGWRGLLKKRPDIARATIVTQAQNWLQHADFACVREPQALANLPEAERHAWQQLWADVADILATAQGKPAPTNKPAAK